MHFSIPSTQEFEDENGTKYSAFNLHVNGVLHCTIRYSQLFDLNEKLKLEFGSNGLPSFPPKRLFSVKGAELEERRQQLESYVQELCQNSKFSSSSIFATFLSRAQQETQLQESLPVNFQIFLMNGSKIKINIQNTDKTAAILESSMAALGLDESLTYYFGLFLVKSASSGNYSLIRQLQEFECPYLSLKSAEEPNSCKVVIRKAYWDQSYDQIVWHDNIGLNLLNVQAESDIKIGWTDANADSRKRLDYLKAKGSKKEYVQFCQTLPNYGCIQLDPCLTNFPKEDTNVVIDIGNCELLFTLTMSGGKIRQEKFSVVRIKSWRVATIVDKNASQKNQKQMIFAFEYLVSKGNLHWIRVTTKQAIMLSMAVKSMVDELLRRRRGEKMKKPSDREANEQKPLFKPRDKTTEVLFNKDEIDLTDSTSNLQKAKDSVKKLSEKFSGSTSAKPTLSGEATTEDDARTVQTFEKICDDDL